MKNRTTILALVLCVMNSLALADNPSDAPLVTVEQQDTTANTTVDATRHHPRNKDVCSAKKMSHAMKSEDQKIPQNMPVPVASPAS